MSSLAPSFFTLGDYCTVPLFWSVSGYVRRSIRSTTVHYPEPFPEEAKLSEEKGTEDQREFGNGGLSGGLLACASSSHLIPRRGVHYVVPRLVSSLFELPSGVD